MVYRYGGQTLKLKNILMNGDMYSVSEQLEFRTLLTNTFDWPASTRLRNKHVIAMFLRSFLTLFRENRITSLDVLEDNFWNLKAIFDFNGENVEIIRHKNLGTGIYSKALPKKLKDFNYFLYSDHDMVHPIMYHMCVQNMEYTGDKKYSYHIPPWNAPRDIAHKGTLSPVGYRDAKLLYSQMHGAYKQYQWDENIQKQNPGRKEALTKTYTFYNDLLQSVYKYIGFDSVNVEVNYMNSDVILKPVQNICSEEIAHKIAMAVFDCMYHMFKLNHTDIENTYGTVLIKDWEGNQDLLYKIAWALHRHFKNLQVIL